jgi:type II secretory pathway pseudopilin PulG
MTIFHKFRKAFSPIEVLLVTVLLTIFMGAAFTLYYTSSFSVQSKANQEQAMNYAKEGLELVKNIRYDNYLNLESGTYVLEDNSGTYSLVSPGEEILDEFFNRRITISDVYRNEDGEIDAQGQTFDPLTKKITARVTWTGNGLSTKNVILQEYLSDWIGVSWIQTTEDQFDNGDSTNLEVLPSDPSIPDNGKVDLLKTVNNLTYFGSANVGAHANDVFYTNNILYAAVDKNGEGMCSIDISNPVSPVVLDCVDVYGKGLGILASGSYAYVAVNDNSHGLGVVDISDPENLSLVETVNLNGPATGIDIQGNYVFLSVDSTSNPMSIVNISNPETAYIASSTGGIDPGKGIHIDGRYAYLTNDTAELKIYDIVNYNSPVLESTLALQGSGFDSVYKNSYLYVATDNASQGLEVVNVSDPNNPLSVDTYDIGGQGRGVAISFNVLSVAVNIVGAGAQLYDITDPLNLTHLKSLDINGKGLGTYATESYFFEAVDTANQGVAIVSMGDYEYESSGEFISVPHDTGSEATDYKSISWLADTPPGTSISLQLRTADTEENLIGDGGSNPGEDFVGPDGTNSSFYTDSYTAITLNPSRSGNRFFQWRALFSSDTNASPSLDEVTINYE